MLVALQVSALAQFEASWNDVSLERSVVYGLVLCSGVLVGAGLLLTAGVALLRGARWGRHVLGVAAIVTLLGWIVIPLGATTVEPILNKDAHDPLRFVHTLRFEGDLSGELTAARFVLTLAGIEHTCTVGRDSFSLYQVSGRVSGEEVSFRITISPYHGAGTYRSRHEYGASVADPGSAELVVRRANGDEWYARSGTLTVNADEQSGSIDAVDGTPSWQPYSPEGQTHITGSWRCQPGLPLPVR